MGRGRGARAREVGCAGDVSRLAAGRGTVRTCVSAGECVCVGTHVGRGVQCMLGGQWVKAAAYARPNTRSFFL